MTISPLLLRLKSETLTPNQALALEALLDGPQTSTHLARAAQVTTAAMVVILDNLQEKGLIAPYPDLDRRVRCTTLTLNGIATLKSLHHAAASQAA
jgi:DNA-binding MarR family transcriptional regulator